MPEKPQINFRISADKKSELERWADDEGRSISNLICHILSQAMEKRENASRRSGPQPVLKKATSEDAVNNSPHTRYD